MTRPESHERSWCAQGGFTLVEVLIALVILGMLLVGLAASVQTGLALRDAQAQRVADTADLDATMRLVRRLLTRLPTTEGERIVTAANGAGFKGETEQLSFIGDLPTGFGTTRRAEMTLHLRDAQMILSWIPHRHEVLFDANPVITDTILLNGVERIEMAYWGAAVTGQPGFWQGRWERPDAPELIRMRLFFPKGDRRHWPDLITSPRPG